MRRKETSIQTRPVGSEVWLRDDVYAVARGPTGAEWRESGRLMWIPGPLEMILESGVVF